LSPFPTTPVTEYGASSSTRPSETSGVYEFRFLDGHENEWWM
jgi:hypothetical protein